MIAAALAAIHPGHLLSVACLIATPAYSAAAQLSASLDAGLATVRYDEYLRSPVYSVSPTLRLEYPLSAVAARGTFSQFESGSRSLDLALAASTFTRPAGILRAELSGVGGGSVFNGLATAYAAAGVRVHALGAGNGIWVGGSGGYVDDGIEGTSANRVGFGAWTRFAGLSISAMAHRLMTPDVSVTDIEAGARYSRGAFSMGAGVGSRDGGGALYGAAPWGEVSASYWLGRHVAAVVAHGRYPPDPGRGTPGAHYSVFTLRLASRPPALVDVFPIRPPGAATPVIARPVVASFSARGRGEGSYLITVRAPAARRVEIMGDFTSWRAREMTPSPRNDNFSILVDVRPGTHQFVIRVDRGEWGVPPGVPNQQDELAGIVALLIVPPDPPVEVSRSPRER